MSTRMYLSSASAPVAPAFGNEWDNIGGAIRRLLARPKANSASEERAISEPTIGPSRLLAQFVSPALATGMTIAGAAVGNADSGEGTGTFRATAITSLKVVDGAGSIVRGTLIDESETTLPIWGGGRVKWLNNVTMSSVAAQAGDRLVLEIAVRRTATSATPTLALWVGDAESDMPDQTFGATGTGTPVHPAGWIELSADLTFEGSLPTYPMNPWWWREFVA